MKTAAEAKADGFTVDRTCYPWFAYKGPRFNPIESHEVETERETEQRETIEALEVECADAEVKRNVAKQRIDRLVRLVRRVIDRGGVLDDSWLYDADAECPRE